MWKILVKIGIDYIQRHLLTRLKVNIFLAAFLERVLVMGEHAVDRVTDSDPDNEKQLRQLLEENYEEMLSLLLAGGATALKDSEVKKRTIAILEDALLMMKNPLPNPAVA